MFSLLDRPTRLCDGISRRELLRVGGLHLAGLSLASLLQRSVSAAPSAPRIPSATFGKARHVIYVWLQGGPPQHETFDPKPEAPVEIRGPFRPIQTNIPGIHFGELLPRIACLADKLAVVRSMSTDDNLHDGSGYWILTGNKYRGPNSREIRPSDWPYFGSLVKMLQPSQTMAPLTSVWLPDVMRLNDNVQPAGQTAGFLGQEWEPERFICDPSQSGFQIEGLNPPAEIPALRLSRRMSLLDQVQQHFDQLERGPAAHQFGRIQQDALGLLTSGKARAAFDIELEPERVRDRYGRNQWGQCLLLARRLIEADVRLVHVNWCREPGDTAVDNPMWDTHAQNADRLQDVLCPQFDVGFTALIEDLDQRGLLDETLVVCIGEFGRTPKINAVGGRDHWGPVFSFALAGAGIRGGQVHGASDKAGALPAADRVQPPDLVATIFHLLGIDHHTTFPDRTGRRLPLVEGEPLHALLGTSCATNERVLSTGDVALVPPYDPSPLVNVSFDEPDSLLDVDQVSRFKGWRATPLWQSARPTDLSVRLASVQAPFSRSGTQHVQIGFGMDGSECSGQLAPGARALLTQEVRSPRAGRYRFSVHACAVAATPEQFRELFLKHFTCRLEIFGYLDLKKDPRQVRVFASSVFLPELSAPEAADYKRFEVMATLRSQDGGAMETSRGVGVAVILEKSSPGVLNLASLGAGAFLRIDDAQLEFNARPRDDNVKV